MSYSSKNPKISTTILTDQTTSSVSAAPSSSHRLINRSGNLWLVDSSGVERPVGGASSGINYLSDWFNGSKAIGTVATVAATGNITVAGSKPLTNSAWYADTTSGAAAIALSSSTALRFSSNYLTALSGSSSSGATFVQTAAFTVDDSDLGKPVSISFDLTGVTTADDWDVVVARYTVSSTTGTYAELIPVAGTASSITGTPGAQLPTGTTQFRGFFIAGSTSTDVYALRFRRRTGTTQIRLDSLTVGPQSLAQGAVVTGWQSYTPTFNGFGTCTGIDAKWRRVGTSLQAQIKFTSGTVPLATPGRVSIPSGLTIDSSSQNKIVGQVATQRTTTSGTPNIALVFVASGQTTNISFTNVADGTVKNLSEIDSTALFSNSIAQSLQFEVPISEWSSGTTTLADRAVEEYAWSTDTTVTAGNIQSDNGLYGYGPIGSRFYAFASTTANSRTTKRVRFQTPILPTDSIILEITENAGNTWQAVSNSFVNGTQASTSVFGMQVTPISGSSTDYYVRFGNMGYLQSSGTYANAGAAWTDLSTNANYLWRLRKVSGGAAVGFPIGARNIVGDTSGTAVPAGYVGEVISSKTSVATSTVTGVYFDAATITLPSSGTYRLDSSVRYSLNGATITTWQGELFFGTTTGNSNAGFELNENYWNTPSPAISSADCSINATQVINYNSSTGVVTFSGGATMTLVGGVLRLKSRPGGFTGGPIQYRAFLTATRIA